MKVIDVKVRHLVPQECVGKHDFLNIETCNTNNRNIRTLAEAFRRVPLRYESVNYEMRLLKCPRKSNHPPQMIHVSS